MEREQFAYLIIAVLVLGAAGAAFYAWYNARDRAVARQRARQKRVREASQPLS